MSLLRFLTRLYWDEMLTCGRCRKYRFLDWGYRLCGTCYHKIKDKTGKLPGEAVADEGLEEGLRVTVTMRDCPFCGHPGTKAVIYTDGKRYRVHCGSCDASGPLSIILEGNPDQAMTDAVRRWNGDKGIDEPMPEAVRKDREVHLANMAFRIGVPPYWGPRHK